MASEFDAQYLPEDLLARAARGEAVVIVRDGQPIARLLPAAYEAEPEFDEVAERLRAGFRHMREAAAIGGLDWRDLARQPQR